MDAYYSTVVSYLGLKAKDISELGGITDRYARDLIKGKRAFPEYIKEAIDELVLDVDIVRDNVLETMKKSKQTDFIVFRDNEELRNHRSNRLWPKRGCSAGGFSGPHRVAMLEAYFHAGEGYELRYHDS